MGSNNGAPSEGGDAKIWHEECVLARSILLSCSYNQTKKNIELIRKAPIPAAHRGVVWLHTCGAKARQQSATNSYRDILRTHEGESSTAIRQIEKVSMLFKKKNNPSQQQLIPSIGPWPYFAPKHSLSRGAWIAQASTCCIFMVWSRSWLLSEYDLESLSLLDLYHSLHLLLSPINRHELCGCIIVAIHGRGRSILDDRCYRGETCSGYEY